MHSSQLVKSCPVAASCSGCSEWGTAISAQIKRKTDQLRQNWLASSMGPCPEIEVLQAGDRGLRDRLDFRWQQGQLGLYDKNRDQLVDIDQCLQLSDPLQSWYSEFRKFKWPFNLASIRLRISPTGLKGVWLDLPHTDVKDLFADPAILKELLTLSVVEVGQRRKNLVWDDNDLRLRLQKEPHFEHWTRTWINDQDSLSLFSRIADFSQAGDRINQVLVAAVRRHLNNEKLILDWGAGSGNLSLAALEKAEQIWAIDHDENSLMGLRQTLKQNIKGLDRVHVQAADFHKVGVLEDISRAAGRHLQTDAQTWIVDPPRSGAGPLFLNIPVAVSKIISVSCFAPSFVSDSIELFRQGFKCQSLAMVDQFPQTPHVEWVSLWIRD